MASHNGCNENVHDWGQRLNIGRELFVASLVQQYSRAGPSQNENDLLCPIHRPPGYFSGVGLAMLANRSLPSTHELHHPVKLDLWVVEANYDYARLFVTVLYLVEQSHQVL